MTGFYFSLKIFPFSPDTASRIYHWFFIILCLLVLRTSLNIVHFFCYSIREKAKESGNTYRELLMSLVEPTVKTGIWLVMILFI